jgi:hypothetical protein
MVLRGGRWSGRLVVREAPARPALIDVSDGRRVGHLLEVVRGRGHGRLPGAGRGRLSAVVELLVQGPRQIGNALPICPAPDLPEGGEVGGDHRATGILPPQRHQDRERLGGKRTAVCSGRPGDQGSDPRRCFAEALGQGPEPGLAGWWLGHYGMMRAAAAVRSTANAALPSSRTVERLVAPASTSNLASEIGETYNSP